MQKNDCKGWCEYFVNLVHPGDGGEAASYWPTFSTWLRLPPASLCVCPGPKLALIILHQMKERAQFCYMCSHYETKSVRKHIPGEGRCQIIFPDSFAPPSGCSLFRDPIQFNPISDEPSHNYVFSPLHNEQIAISFIRITLLESQNKYMYFK